MPKFDQGIDTSLKRQRYAVIPRTLVFITRDDRVLLLRGAPTKRIWANKYNGIGGHVERDEDVYAAAQREVREETGLEVAELRLAGVINIDGDQSAGIMLFVFTAQSRSGNPIPSEEGALEWIARNQLTQIDLVEDLPVILPRALELTSAAPPFFAHYHYDEQERLVIRFS
ncbi:dihydroneopterin triphosphate diphosphatase [Thermoflexales bacterium]|nr:dihydroneopterin triphosphate diphosphatase [Thermoflexales bacterium]